MYIIEKLKIDYPQYTENIEAYSNFLSRLLSEDIKQKIFDDGKYFYKFIHFVWVCDFAITWGGDNTSKC